MPKRAANAQNPADARNQTTGKQAPVESPEYQQYGIYAKTAPHAEEVQPVETVLPLQIQPDTRIALIGNTLFDRARSFGFFETMLYQRYPEHNLIVRNLSWAGDTVDLQPRPENFADLDQHLTHEKIDLIFAAYGYNESFAGPDGIEAFRVKLTDFLQRLRTRAFNGRSAPQIALISPIANENVARIPAGDLNNDNIQRYSEVMRDVAAELNVAFVNVFDETQQLFASGDTDLTINGAHLTGHGYEQFARILHRRVFAEDASAVNDELRALVIDKNRQYFRRYRPLNTFYYTGGRSADYGYLDFLPAMKNFDLMVAEREQLIQQVVQGRVTNVSPDDSDLPLLPDTKESRGANEWMTAAQERAEFQVDPRFDVNLFAGEEEFPEIAAPIQMRWDNQGRLWVSCSTTYPHVYPGNEPDDRLVILEDTDGDGKA
ncbi:MAG: hypothetical protein KDA85_16025, partial [Planctomycetaceae bacterium]|nr:hypothetical protein [Planctomycetaceae bacterium]